MLLDFQVKNFKSLKNNVLFSMIADLDVDEQEYSILKECIDNLDIFGLSSAVIYGPNAVSKSNLIQALSFLKKMILNNRIDLESQFRNPINLSYIPNVNTDDREDVEFEITIINSCNIYTYKLNLNFGRFGMPNVVPKVTYERLLSKEQLIFERKGNQISYLNQDYLMDGLEFNKKLIHSIDQKLKSEDLFVNSGSFLFKRNVIENFKNWFERKLIIIPSTRNLEVRQTVLENLINQDSEFKSKLMYLINEILKTIKQNNSEFWKPIEDQSGNNVIRTFIKSRDSEEIFLVPPEEFESDGILKLTNILSIVIKALINGCTLIIDELDSSIQSTFIMSLLSIFHDDRINKNNAQLIFTTHNPIFMSSRFLRRDEIVFLNRKPKSSIIEIYTLSDFNDVSKRDNYIKDYFENQYGALEEINLNELIKEFLGL